MWASLSTGTSGVDARGGAARAHEGAARQTPVAGPQRDGLDRDAARGVGGGLEVGREGPTAVKGDAEEAAAGVSGAVAALPELPTADALLDHLRHDLNVICDAGTTTLLPKSLARAAHGCEREGAKVGA